MRVSRSASCARLHRPPWFGVLETSAIIPMALVTLYRGWNNQLDKHRWIARITLPVWLYVSVTGVAIYWMLYS